MKLKLKHFIPWYGMFLYFRDYWNSQSRGYEEANQALGMTNYHTLICCMSIMFIVKIILC